MIEYNGKLMSWDYLTDENNWFLVDSKYMKIEPVRWTWTAWDEVNLPPETEMQKAIREAVEMLK